MKARQKAWPTVRTLGLNALLTIGAIIVAFLLVEASIRLLNLDSTDLAAGGGLKAILQFDQTLETRYNPNGRSRIASPYGEFDVEYEINNLGLRERTFAEKQPNEFRVLVLGNSFVEG